MAYTITEPTYPLMPGDNLSWNLANSTNKNENSFVYKFTVQVADIGDAFTAGTGADVAGVFRVPPRPGDGKGQFASNYIVKNFLATPVDFQDAIYGGATSAGYKQTRIIYGEEYYNNSGTFVQATGGNGATKRIWNAVIQDENFPDYDWTDWEVGPTASGVQFLTDGPGSRCALQNDLLYALIGPSGPSPVSWTTLNTIQNEGNWLADGFGAAWFQVANPDSTGGTNLTWMASGGDGLYTDGNTGYLSYSNILYAVPYPDNGTVNLAAGGTYNVNVLTSVNYGDQFVGVWLYGKRADNGVWEQIGDLVEYDNSGQAGYSRSGTAAVAYTNLGIATDAGYYLAQYFEQVISWDFNNPAGDYLWEVNPAVGSNEYFQTQLGSLNYLNVGLAGVTGNAPYTVRIVNSDSLAPYTESISYTTNCNTCSSCEKVTLTWLNSKGGFDTYEFNCLSQKGINVTRTIGERSLTQGYVKGSRGRLNPNNVGKVIKKVSTNYERQEQIDWLESLLMSPDVYEVQSDTSLIPVTIENTSYSAFVRQDKLKLAEFDYTIAYNRRSQSL